MDEEWVGTDDGREARARLGGDPLPPVAVKRGLFLQSVRVAFRHPKHGEMMELAVDEITKHTSLLDKMKRSAEYRHVTQRPTSTHATQRRFSGDTCSNGTSAAHAEQVDPCFPTREYSFRPKAIVACWPLIRLGRRLSRLSACCCPMTWSRTVSSRAYHSAITCSFTLDAFVRRKLE
eukprot:6183523-Pleurochrysis_carterae.AAC.3